MKNIFLIISLLFSFVCTAQIYQQEHLFGKQVNRLNVLSDFSPPQDTIAVPAIYQSRSHLSIKDTVPYLWSPSQLRWIEWKGGGGAGNAILAQYIERQIANFRIDGIGSATEFRTTKIQPDTIDEDDFEIDIFPDIQNMSSFGALQYQAAGRSMFQWVLDNQATENIKAVIQLGDLVDHGNNTQDWDTAASWFNMLDGIGLPYVAAIGNHDYDGGSNSSPARGTTNYNTYFGASRMGSKSHLGGVYQDKYENAYYSLDVGRKKFFILNMEFIPRNEVIEWAGGVLDSLYSVEPDREVIILTHAYITAFNERATDTSTYSNNTYGIVGNSGDSLWHKLIKKKPNIKWVLNGHYIIPGAWAKKGLTGRITSAGENGNIINQIFIDYQDDTDWGNGYFMRLKFKPAINKIDVNVYSNFDFATVDTIHPPSDTASHFGIGYDPRFTPYTIDDPALGIKSALGVAGNLAVGEDLRVAGKLKVESLNKNRIAVIGEDDEIKDSPNFIWHQNTGFKVKGTNTTTLGQVYPAITTLQADSFKITTPVLSSFAANGTTSLMQIRAWRHTSFPQYTASIFIGDSTGYGLSPTTSSTVNTVAIGANALRNATTPNFTVAIGARSLQAYISGSFNTAVGNESLKSLTSGEANTAIGAATLASMTSGADNTAFGNAALTGHLTGNSNTAIGSSALQKNTIGKENTAIGTGAMLENLTGDSSTAIGRSAGRFAMGSRNIFIGYNAGYSATGNDQIYIDNTNTATPLFYGDMAKDSAAVNGNLTVTDTLTTITYSTSDSSNRAASTAWVKQLGTIGGGGGGGSGEVNTASNLGGGLDNFSGKSGVDLQFNSFNSSHFSLSSNLLSITNPLTTGTQTIGGLKTFTDNINLPVSNTQIFYSNSGVPTGSSNLIWNNANKTLSISGTESGNYSLDLVRNTSAASTFMRFHDNATGGQLVYENGSSSGFFPIFTMRPKSWAVGMFAVEPTTQDNTFPAITMRARINSTNAALTTMRVFGVYNATTPLFTIDHNGRWNMGASASYSGSSNRILYVDTNEDIQSAELGEDIEIVSGVLQSKTKILHTNISDIGNVTTGEDNLTNHSLSANALATDNSYLEFYTFIDLAINANAKNIKAYFGSDQIVSTIVAPASGGGLIIKGRIYRVDQNNQKIIWEILGTNITPTTFYSTATQDLSTSVAFKVTGEGVASDDIVQKVITLTYHHSN